MDRPTRPVPHEEREIQKPKSQVRVKIFGKNVAWIWIVVALILLLGIVTFFYVTYARHRRRVKSMAHKMAIDDAKNAATCAIPTKTRDKSLLQAKSSAADQEASDVMRQLEEMPLHCVSSFRERRGGLVKPEDEWQSKSGREWIQKKLAEIEKPCVKPRKAPKTRPRNHFALAYKQDKSDFLEQNWTSEAGVFDLFEQIEAIKNTYRDGSCPINPPPPDIQLPFDIDYQKFCRRLDAQYSHKTWWR